MASHVTPWLFLCPLRWSLPVPGIRKPQASSPVEKCCMQLPSKHIFFIPQWHLHCSFGLQLVFSWSLSLQRVKIVKVQRLLKHTLVIPDNIGLYGQIQVRLNGRSTMDKPRVRVYWSKSKAADWSASQQIPMAHDDWRKSQVISVLQTKKTKAQNYRNGRESNRWSTWQRPKKNEGVWCPPKIPKVPKWKKTKRVSWPGARPLRLIALQFA